jgi:hypothetical protein
MVLLLAIALGFVAPAAAQDSVRAQSRPRVAESYLGLPVPGDTPILFAPGLVSTGLEHSAAMITPDGTEIWFARMFPAEIYYLRLDEGEWIGPTIAPFSSGFRELYPRLSPDGRRIFFSSGRPPEPEGGRLPPGQGQLWVVDRLEGGWSEPRHLGPQVNIGLQQGGPSQSESGRIYFNSTVVEGSRRSTNIYTAIRVGDGYADLRMVEELSSDAPDHSPFIAPDESYVIFSSFRGGFGLSDLFIAFRGPEGGWTEPRNLGSRINTAAKEEYPYVTPDGRFLFFNSNRVSSLNEERIPDGPGNIYWVDARIIEELRSVAGGRR